MNVKIIKSTPIFDNLKIGEMFMISKDDTFVAMKSGTGDENNTVVVRESSLGIKSTTAGSMITIKNDTYIIPVVEINIYI